MSLYIRINKSTKQKLTIMTTILAYAISFLLNLGLVSKDDVNSRTNDLKVYDRDGKTVVVDSITGTEIIIAA